MRRPKVSVLVPVYNTEEYLERCLDSILSQSLVDIEVICVNDGSKDKSGEILERYRKRDRRIRVITKENGGLPSARNAGLDAAIGEYVGFVDSDDYIEPNMFKRMVEAAENDGSEIVVCGANIFPDEPRADAWLYDTLSTGSRYYKEYDPDIFYTCNDTTPFLWRNLIKKSLIDKKEFRLDERISIGEDKLFQAKIYPYANGITVIPDRLYNYFWCRTDSLMNQINYDKLSRKTVEHAKLVSAMLDDINSGSLHEAIRKKALDEFFRWAVTFLCDNFIISSENDRVISSKIITHNFNDSRIEAYVPLFEDWRKDQLKYIKSFDDGELKKVRLSVVIPVEYGTEYIGETVDLINEYKCDPFEFIFVNNGVSNADYIRLLKLLYSQKNVRLYNTPKHFTYAECLNIGVRLAEGDYVVFLETKDSFVSSDRLREWLESTEENKYDVCCCLKYKNVFSDIDAIVTKDIEENAKDRMSLCDFHEVLYKRAFLKKNEIDIKNYNCFTGFAFLCEVLERVENIGVYEESCYIFQEAWKKDWIETKKIEEILDCLNYISKTSVEKKLPFLHARVYRMLNSDLFKHMIVNGTRIYRMNPGDCPNGENSQEHTICALYSIIDNADYEMLRMAGYKEKESILSTLIEVVSERNKFLAEM